MDTAKGKMVMAMLGQQLAIQKKVKRLSDTVRWTYQSEIQLRGDFDYHETLEAEIVNADQPDDVVGKITITCSHSDKEKAVVKAVVTEQEEGVAIQLGYFKLTDTAPNLTALEPEKESDPITIPESEDGTVFLCIRASELNLTTVSSIQFTVTQNNTPISYYETKQPNNSYTNSKPILAQLPMASWSEVVHRTLQQVLPETAPEYLSLGVDVMFSFEYEEIQSRGELPLLQLAPSPLTHLSLFSENLGKQIEAWLNSETRWSGKNQEILLVPTLHNTKHADSGVIWKINPISLPLEMVDPNKSKRKTIELFFIDKSNYSNGSPIVFLQKVKELNTGKVTIANNAIPYFANGDKRKLHYSPELSATQFGKDGNNQRVVVENGEGWDFLDGEAADLLQVGPPAAVPTTIEVRNTMTTQKLKVDYYNYAWWQETIGTIAPGQKAIVELEPEIRVAMMPNYGKTKKTTDRVHPNTFDKIHTKFSLTGIKSATITLSGGGSPFEYGNIRQPPIPPYKIEIETIKE
jgi:hypothetical protein